MAGSRWSAAAVAGLMASLVLIGCGAESEASDVASGDEVAVGSWLERTSDEAPSRILEYILDGDLQKMNRLLADRGRQQQEVTKQCMAEQGFEWVVILSPATSESLAGEPSGRWDGLTRAEFVDAWGYGISTALGPDGAPLAGVPGSTSAEPEPSAPDANAVLWGALPPDRQPAYLAALHGEEGGDGGCLQQGLALSFESPDAAVAEQFAAMSESIEQRLVADPQAAVAVDRYRLCLEEAGFGNITHPGAGDDLIRSRLDEAVWHENPASGERFVNADALKKLQRFELTLAAAEFSCRATFELAEEAARILLERQAIKDHPDLVEQMRVFYASFDV